MTSAGSAATRAGARHSELSPGSVGYVDADWVSADGESWRTWVVWRDGVLLWRDVQCACELGDDPDRAAARTLFAVAESAASRVRELGAARVEVVGEGFLAALVRRLLGVAPDVEGLAPQAIVDVSGDPEQLVAATRRLGPMGSLLMLGERGGLPLEIDLYPDVHVRGLRLVGVPPLLSLPSPADLSPLEDVLALHPPAIVGSDDRLRGAAWYRIEP